MANLSTTDWEIIYKCDENGIKIIYFHPAK